MGLWDSLSMSKPSSLMLPNGRRSESSVPPPNKFHIVLANVVAWASLVKTEELAVPPILRRTILPAF